MILALLQIVLVDAPDSPAARTLKALWPELRVVDAPVEAKLVIGMKGELAAYRALKGATVVVDLAVLGPVEEVRIENPNRLPIDPYDIRTIEEVGRDWERHLTKKEPAAERTLKVRDGLRAEVGEPIPRMRIVAEDPALRGFPVGALVPWCAHRDGVYVQRTSAADGALAVSEQNGKAVILRQGSLYAMDLRLEELRGTWDHRGALHKWVPVSNLAGRGVLAGRFWTSKPTYKEYLKELRAFAAAHPEWAVSVIGRRGDDEILAFTRGDPSQELHVFVGMFHASDEWAPALGALSLMELLSRARPSRSIKVIPIMKPSLYDFEGEDRVDVQKNDRIYALAQLHQGGDVLVPACGTSTALARRVAERARESFAGRHATWPSGLSKVAPMPTSWASYFWQGGKTSIYGLYPHDAVFSAKALYLVEQDFMLLMPERFTQSNAHHWHHRMFFEHSSVATLLLTDQTANWGLALVTTEHAGDDRDPTWKP
ncbi:MAG TPA: hypothetical protein VF950_24965 [Planctomycetota bacterium]